MHVCNFHKLALQASMVFHNIVELCIIQIRPELWPRTVLRKITDPLPFLAHWAQIFSVCLESQRGNWTFYPKHYCKTVAQRLCQRDKSCGKLGQGRGRTSESGDRQRPGLGLRNRALDLQITFQTSSEIQLGRSVYENSTWGYCGGNAKLRWGFSNSSDTVVRYGERWLFF